MRGSRISWIALCLIPLPALASGVPGKGNPLADCISSNDITTIEKGMAPPPVDSAADRNDIQDVLDAQSRRTDADCKRALSEMEISTANFFGVSGVLSPSELQSLDPFLTQSSKAMDPIVKGLKDSFSRERPAARFPKLVHPCPPVDASYHPGTSYPSSHAAVAYLEALILAEIFPSRHDEFVARAKEVGHDRVVLGVHHPTDVEAGFMIAQRTYDILNHCQKFIDRLHEAQSHYAAAAAAPEAAKVGAGK